ncbi:hypothetical protein D3C72_1772980 [compost metagenome]
MGRLIPFSAQTRLMVGNRCATNSGSRWLRSSQTWSVPSAAIWRAIARATTSRGARSRIGCTPAIKASPARFLKTAPSPRTASEIKKVGLPGRYRAVGWNWMNSTSRIAAPARWAMATPSPVATAGLVVCL